MSRKLSFAKYHTNARDSIDLILDDLNLTFHYRWKNLPLTETIFRYDGVVDLFLETKKRTSVAQMRLLDNGAAFTHQFKKPFSLRMICGIQYSQKLGFESLTPTVDFLAQRGWKFLLDYDGYLAYSPGNRYLIQLLEACKGEFHCWLLRRTSRAKIYPTSCFDPDWIVQECANIYFARESGPDRLLSLAQRWESELKG